MYYKMKEYFKNEMKQLREELTESGFDNLDDLINIIMVGKDVIFVKDDETVSDAIVDKNEAEEHGYEMLWELYRLVNYLKTASNVIYSKCTCQLITFQCAQERNRIYTHLQIAL